MAARASKIRTVHQCVTVRAWVRTVLMVAAVASVGAFETARANCSDPARALREALAARDLDAARRHHDTVWRDTSCDDGFRDRAGRAVSLLHARIAQERMEAGESLASQRVLLERGLGYARTWPVLALLGDSAHGAQDYDRASVMYQEALTAIDDEIRTPKPPPSPEIERIIRRAAQSRLLASQYTPAPMTRSGTPGGLAATHIRGIAIERVPIPITFHTDTAEFTNQGLRAAADMAAQLRAQRPERITIAGHTDPRGTEAHNFDLSRRRAEAVARYLREQGFAGQVVVVAKGESERFPVDDPAAYTREQRWQMDRRVELIR